MAERRGRLAKEKMRNDDEEIDIAEAARLSGVPASALRYYEQKGLIAPVGRRGLRRLYRRTVLDRLALIALGRAAGFALDQIKDLLPRAANGELDRALLSARAEAIDAQIERLAKIRDGLRGAARCPSQSQQSCPRFQSFMNSAVREAAAD